MTTSLVTLVMLAVWEVSLILVVPFAAVFLLIEGAFVSANLVKVRQRPHTPLLRRARPSLAACRYLGDCGLWDGDAATTI